jgi:hypothetical protein
LGETSFKIVLLARSFMALVEYRSQTSIHPLAYARQRPFLVSFENY